MIARGRFLANLAIEKRITEKETDLRNKHLTNNYQASVLHIYDKHGNCLYNRNDDLAINSIQDDVDTLEEVIDNDGYTFPVNLDLEDR